MKMKQISLIVLMIFFTTGIALCAESSTNENRSAIGIRLDSAPLPELLVKHLGLKPGQGLRIANVMKNSAADEAGLERDDIVIGFQGKDVSDAAALTNEVRQIGIGKEVSLEIIHLGQRKTVTLKLKAVITGTPEWKYPDEPQVEQFFQPGRIFRYIPDDNDWAQIFNNQIPNDVRANINSIFNEMYSSTYLINGKTYSVTIEGSPNDNASRITVKIDNNDYKTTIGEIDKMPKDYQEAAKKAIDNAKQKAKNHFPSFPDGFGSTIMPPLNSNGPQINTPNSSSDEFIQRMEEQMKQMQKQFRELEESHQRLLKRLDPNQI